MIEQVAATVMIPNGAKTSVTIADRKARAPQDAYRHRGNTTKCKKETRRRSAGPGWVRSHKGTGGMRPIELCPTDLVSEVRQRTGSDLAALCDCGQFLLDLLCFNQNILIQIEPA
jgi:hypothetical protein